MGKFFKIGVLTNMQSTVTVDDKWFIPRDRINTKNEGVTFIPDGDGSPKVLWEGHGLKKFKGKFMNPAENKNSLGYKGNDVDNVSIPHQTPGKYIKKNG